MGNINPRQFLILAAVMLALYPCGRAIAAEKQEQYVQIAELEIDPAHLESYRAAVREQIEAAVRVEPGVLVLYAVSQKDNPSRITVLEVYADTDAYRAHLEAPHFKKYKATVESMVRSLKLIQTDPIMLDVKAK